MQMTTGGQLALRGRTASLGGWLRQMVLQSDSRLFTRAVSSSHFSQNTDKTFDIAREGAEPLYCVGQRAAGCRILTQKPLPFI
jgi:chorismate-pyruvate lyase